MKLYCLFVVMRSRIDAFQIDPHREESSRRVSRGFFFTKQRVRVFLATSTYLRDPNLRNEVPGESPIHRDEASVVGGKNRDVKNVATNEGPRETNAQFRLKEDSYVQTVHAFLMRLLTFARFWAVLFILRDI